MIALFTNIRSKFVFVFVLVLFSFDAQCVCHANIDMDGKSMTNIASDYKIVDSLATVDGLKKKWMLRKPFKYIYFVMYQGKVQMREHDRLCFNLKNSDIVTNSSNTKLKFNFSDEQRDEILARHKAGDGWSWATTADVENGLNQIYDYHDIDMNEFGKYKTVGQPWEVSPTPLSSINSVDSVIAGGMMPHYKSMGYFVYMRAGTKMVASANNSGLNYFFSSATGLSYSMKTFCVKYSNSKIKIEGVEYPLD